MRDERRDVNDNAGLRSAFPQARIEGISESAVAAFCDAIEFGVRAEQPTEGELRVLERALRRIATEAHEAGLTPERLLIGLKTVWSRVCQRVPSPDMYDPVWHLVVRESLRAYHAVGR